MAMTASGDASSVHWRYSSASAVLRPWTPRTSAGFFPAAARARIFMPWSRSSLVSREYSRQLRPDHPVDLAPVEKVDLAREIFVVDFLRGRVRRRHDDKDAAHWLLTRSRENPA